MGSVNPELVLKFRNMLRTFRADRRTGSVTNRHPWQTRLAILELLDLAETEAKLHGPQDIRILSGAFPGHFYNEQILDRLQAALEYGCRARILVWDQPPEARNPEAELLLQTYPRTFQISWSGTREDGENLWHFQLIGDTAYRVEAPHAYYPPDARFTDYEPPTVARICFNDPQLAKVLAEFFDELCQAVASKQSTVSID